MTERTLARVVTIDELLPIEGADRIKQYVKRPVVINAIQWTGNNLEAVMQFCSGDSSYELMARGGCELVIHTLEDGIDKVAKHVASRGDFIIQGVQGEFYACKPDIFELTYMVADGKKE